MRAFGKFSRWTAAIAGLVVGVGVLWAQPALAAPTMSVSPTSGAAGSSLTVSGTECTDGSGGGVGGAAIGRDANGNSNLDPGEDMDDAFQGATTAGGWSVTLTVPSGTAPGSLLVEGICVAYYDGQGFDYPDASFTVTAGVSSNALTVDDTTVTPGQRITAEGSGFRSGSSGSLVLFSDPKVLGSGTANSSGVIRITATIPADTTAGTHRLELQGVDGAGAARVLSATITVSPGGTLPRTGSSMPLRAVAFVGTFTIGAGVVVLAVRKMRADPLWPI
jgi:hypothetical protein